MSSPPNPSGDLATQKADVDRIFHALGDPTRRAILEHLGDGPLSVSRLADPLGITLTAVIQHLQILEECGLVRTEKTGRVRTCRIDTAGFSALEQWIQARRTIWDRRLDRLGEMLAAPDDDEQDSMPSGIS
jgi:DNA-binding transcriptional ArsR family regulator